MVGQDVTSDEEPAPSWYDQANEDDEQHPIGVNTLHHDSEGVETGSFLHATGHELLEEDHGDSINVVKETEDILNNFALPEDDNVLDPNGAALACAIEFDRANGYQERRERYHRRGEELIESQWTVEVKPARTGIAIGDRVRENKNFNPQYGTNVGLILPGEEGNDTRRKLWTVHYDGKQFAEPGISGLSLCKLHDDRVFKWKIMDDSEPDHPVPTKDTTGIVGFDFEKSFETKNVSAPEESYDFPFMRLLIHMWPGTSTWLIAW